MAIEKCISNAISNLKKSLPDQDILPDDEIKNLVENLKSEITNLSNQRGWDSNRATDKVIDDFKESFANKAEKEKQKAYLNALTLIDNIKILDRFGYSIDGLKAITTGVQSHL